MSEICLWLEKVLNWVDRCGPPAIPHIGKAPQGYRNPPAPHLEIAYLLNHRITDLAIGDKVVAIPPYHVTLLNVHQGNFTPALQRFDSWCLFLDVGRDKDFADLHNRPLFCSAPLPLNQEVNAAFERVGNQCVRYKTGPMAYPLPKPLYDPVLGRSVNPLGALRIKASLLDLFALLLDVLGPQTGKPLHPPAVQRAIEFMSLRYRDPTLTLTDVSRAASLNRDHFGRLFHQHMGETPMCYLRAMRIQQARYLLEHTALSVGEIAAHVGFADPLHFSRVFRAIAGKSPSAWRARS
jgi:AraC-like DNA-binding protein